MLHYAVCYEFTPGARVACVESFATEARANSVLHRATSRQLKRVGYVGCKTLDEAVKRVGMMERNESGAWGVVA